MAMSPASLPTGTVPFVSAVELADFCKRHFSGYSKNYFAANFIAEEVAEEDDGLGYYSDGVKRTLTDEQIAIFRHTEIETLLKEKTRSDGVKTNTALNTEKEVVEEPDLQFTSAVDTQALGTQLTSSEDVQQSVTKSTTADQRRKKSHFKRNIKPDLRKRTWDKVDLGLETLAYEEEATQSSPKRNAGPQRRTVSYDDM